MQQERSVIERQQHQPEITPPSQLDTLLNMPDILPQERVIFLAGVPMLKKPWHDTPPIAIASVSSQELAFKLLQARGTLPTGEITERFSLAEQVCGITRQLTEREYGSDYYDDSGHQREIIDLASRILFAEKATVLDDCRSWLDRNK